MAVPAGYPAAMKSRAKDQAAMSAPRLRAWEITAKAPPVTNDVTASIRAPPSVSVAAPPTSLPRV
jgi:hypothetical protein